MKKILTGVIAAAALLFGFASCSGDLHDKVVTKLEFGSDYYLAGDMTNWEKGPLIPMTADESDPAKFWAVFDATGEAQSFCFTKDASWTGQIGGNLISAGTLGKDIKYESKDNGFGGVNANLSGLVSGNTYKLVATATNDGTIQIDCAESKAPNYFLLDGFYLKGSFDGDTWPFDMKKVLMDGVKDTATGDVTYKVTIIATKTEEQACIARFDGSVTYKGVSVSAKDGEAKKLSTDGGDIEFTDLENGKGYFVYVVTSVDETVKISIKEAASIQIIGVQVVGLNKADYEGKTFIFGGGQIGWPSAWDGSEATATTVKNGVATVKLETPIKLYETGTKITIAGTVKDNWNCKIASLYKQNDGNSDGSIDISKFAIDYTDYIIYADATGLNSGDKVEWKLVKPTVTVSVTGLPADANGKELYFTGDFNKWTKPGEEGTYKVTVADGSISLVASVDAKSSGKFAAAGWTKPEVCGAKKEDDNGENIAWDGLSFGKTLKGIYVETIDKADGKIYCCTWTVE